jgi:uncharacterized membrane protein YdbT with pleckstrin-like domain
MKLQSTYVPFLAFLPIFGIAMIAVPPFAIIPIFIGLAMHQMFLGIIGALATYVVAIGIAMHLKKRNYIQTYYELDDEKVVYFNGFFSPERKEILYQRILEVDFRQGFLQQLFGLGTVILVTNSGSSNQPMAGINITDVQNPDQVYEAVKKIVYSHIKDN